MISLDKIREDLRDIRYYYAHKAVFEDNVTTVGANIVRSKAKNYNAIIVLAPPRLYDIYVGLYVTGLTYETYAIKSGYAVIYIRKVNNELLNYFQKNLKED